LTTDRTLGWEKLKKLYEINATQDDQLDEVKGEMSLLQHWFFFVIRNKLKTVEQLVTSAGDLFSTLIYE
jgi:hypothetical protein